MKLYTFGGSVLILAMLCCFQNSKQTDAAGLADSSSAIAQDEADILDWNFDSSYANPFESALGDHGKYGIRIDMGASDSFVVTISIRLGDKSVYSWKGHKQSVFVIEDDTLYYARFTSSEQGGTIVAIDLSNGKELWRSDLQGLDGIAHLMYSNRIGLGLGHKGLLIWGDETAGRYLEIKDFHTGKTIGHRIYKSPTTAEMKPK